jgi:hypothetical protein
MKTYFPQNVPKMPDLQIINKSIYVPLFSRMILSVNAHKWKEQNKEVRVDRELVSDSVPTQYQMMRITI